MERRTKEAEELAASVTATAKEKADAFAKAAQAEEALKALQERVNKDYEPQVKRLQEVEKRAMEQEERLRIVDYTSSQEWADKYDKPMADAASEAAELMGQLQVTDENGNQRVATYEDFQAIVNEPNLTVASAAAKARFGPDVFQSVVAFRNRIHSLNRTRQAALKNAQIDSAEHIKRQESDRAQMRETFRNKLFEEVNILTGKEPDIFNPPDHEADLRNALFEGTKLADALLNGDSGLTPDQMIKNIASGRARIIKAGVVEKKLAKANEKIKALEEQLKAFHASEPEVTPRNGGSARPRLSGKDEARDKLLDAATKLATKI